ARCVQLDPALSQSVRPSTMAQSLAEAAARAVRVFPANVSTEKTRSPSSSQSPSQVPIRMLGVMLPIILARARRCEAAWPGLDWKVSTSFASRAEVTKLEKPTPHHPRRSSMISQKLISSVLGRSLLSLAATGCGTATGAAVGTGAGAAVGAG